MVTPNKAEEIRGAIDELKKAVAELETRLQQGRFDSPHQGSLKSIGHPSAHFG
jgi:hypothetical protein